MKCTDCVYQKSENIDFKGLAEVMNKLIFNNLHISAIYGPIFNESLS
jgi:hypothetical protein